MSTASLPTIALAGSTGYLGSQVLKVLTSSAFRPSFKDVIVLKRPSRTAGTSNEDNTSSSDSIYTTRYYDESDLAASLTDVTVLVNTIGSAGHPFKNALVRSLPSVPTLKLYIPSEFGVDHTVHDFPHQEWDHKKSHYALARELLDPRGVKICRIFIGLFTEASIGPWFAFNTRDAIYEAVGSADVPVSFTSLEDTGRVIAALAKLPTTQIPEQIHVASNTLTIREMASIMESAGSSPIDIRTIDLETYKKETLQEGTSDPSKYLRFLMGEGMINHTATNEGLGNDNELVNPNGQAWTWKTMQMYAEETKGRPWGDYAWNPDGVK